MKQQGSVEETLGRGLAKKVAGALKRRNARNGNRIPFLIPNVKSAKIAKDGLSLAGQKQANKKPGKLSALPNMQKPIKPGAPQPGASALPAGSTHVAAKGEANTLLALAGLKSRLAKADGADPDSMVNIFPASEELQVGLGNKVPDIKVVAIGEKPSFPEASGELNFADSVPFRQNGELSGLSDSSESPAPETGQKSELAKFARDLVGVRKAPLNPLQVAEITGKKAPASPEISATKLGGKNAQVTKEASAIDLFGKKVQTPVDGQSIQAAVKKRQVSMDVQPANLSGKKIAVSGAPTAKVLAGTKASVAEEMPIADPAATKAPIAGELATADLVGKKASVAENVQANSLSVKKLATGTKVSATDLAGKKTPVAGEIPIADLAGKKAQASTHLAGSDQALLPESKTNASSQSLQPQKPATLGVFRTESTPGSNRLNPQAQLLLPLPDAGEGDKSNRNPRELSPKLMGDKITPARDSSHQKSGSLSALAAAKAESAAIHMQRSTKQASPLLESGSVDKLIRNPQTSPPKLVADTIIPERIVDNKAPASSPGLAASKSESPPPQMLRFANRLSHLVKTGTEPQANLVNKAPVPQSEPKIETGVIIPDATPVADTRPLESRPLRWQPAHLWPVAKEDMSGQSSFVKAAEKIVVPEKVETGKLPLLNGNEPRSAQRSENLIKSMGVQSSLVDDNHAHQTVRSGLKQPVAKVDLPMPNATLPEVEASPENVGSKALNVIVSGALKQIRAAQLLPTRLDYSQVRNPASEIQVLQQGNKRKLRVPAKVAQSSYPNVAPIKGEMPGKVPAVPVGIELISSQEILNTENEASAAKSALDSPAVEVTSKRTDTPSKKPAGLANQGQVEESPVVQPADSRHTPNTGKARGARKAGAAAKHETSEAENSTVRFMNGQPVDAAEFALQQDLEPGGMSRTIESSDSNFQTTQPIGESAEVRRDPQAKLLRADNRLLPQLARLVKEIRHTIQRSGAGRQINTSFRVDGGSFGGIEIHINEEGGSYQALILVESQSSRSILQKQLPVIQEMLQGNGFEPGSLSVDIGSGETSQKQETDKQAPAGQRASASNDGVETGGSSDEQSPDRNYGYNTFEMLA